jgi:hypothetical protein
MNFPEVSNLIVTETCLDLSERKKQSLFKKAPHYARTLYRIAMYRDEQRERKSKSQRKSHLASSRLGRITSLL